MTNLRTDPLCGRCCQPPPPVCSVARSCHSRNGVRRCRGRWLCTCNSNAKDTPTVPAETTTTMMPRMVHWQRPVVVRCSPPPCLLRPALPLPARPASTHSSLLRHRLRTSSRPHRASPLAQRPLRRHPLGCRTQHPPVWTPSRRACPSPRRPRSTAMAWVRILRAHFPPRALALQAPSDCCCAWRRLPRTVCCS